MYSENKHAPPSLSSLLPNPSQAFTIHIENKKQEEIALAYFKGLEELAVQKTNEELEPVTEQDSEENSYDLQPAPAVELVEQKTSESDEFEVS